MFPGIARLGLKFSTNFPAEVGLFFGQEITFANEQLTQKTPLIGFYELPSANIIGMLQIAQSGNPIIT